MGNVVLYLYNPELSVGIEKRRRKKEIR